MANFEVRSYSVTLSNSNDASWIMLYDSGVVSSSTFRARLNFVAAPTRDITLSNSDTFITIYLGLRQLDSVIDIIRNEKPVYFVWFSVWAGINTGIEPAGEGEIGTP